MKYHFRPKDLLLKMFSDIYSWVMVKYFSEDGLKLILNDGHLSFEGLDALWCLLL